MALIFMACSEFRIVDIKTIIVEKKTKHERASDSGAEHKVRYQK